MSQKLDSPGDRVKYLCRLSGLTRKEFSKKYQISESTLRAWELDITPISEKLMIRFLNALKNEGITTSPPWVRDAIGENPKVAFLKPLSTHKQNGITIDDEISYFLEAGINRVSYTVSNSCNEPFFKEGDIVGAIIYPSNQIEKIINRFCLVQTKENRNWELKLIKRSQKAGRFHLLCSQSHKNPDKCPVLYDIYLENVAPVVLLRKTGI